MIIRQVDTITRRLPQPVIVTDHPAAVMQSRKRALRRAQIKATVRRQLASVAMLALIAAGVLTAQPQAATTVAVATAAKNSTAPVAQPVAVLTQEESSRLRIQISRAETANQVAEQPVVVTAGSTVATQAKQVAPTANIASPVKQRTIRAQRAAKAIVSAEPTQKPDMQLTARRDLRLRATATQNASNTIGYLPAHRSVEVVEDTGIGWYKVRWSAADGTLKQGYVGNAYVTVRAL